MAQPTAYEQYLLELVNRARSNPGAEASRLGIGLNDGLSAGSISDTAKQPLALDPALIDAARQHSTWMLANNTFSHTGAGGSSPGDRMSAAGYAFTGAWGWGENIAIQWGGGATLNQAMGNSLEAQLFKSPGHRANILNDSFREIGAGLAAGTYQGQNAVTATEDFAYSGDLPFLTGVAFTDRSGDNFYEPGERLGGVSVQAKSGTGAVYQATTWDAGGYQMQLPSGTYQVTFSGGGLPGPVTKTATIGNLNVELDLERGATDPTGTTTGGSGGTSGGGTGSSNNNTGDTPGTPGSSSNGATGTIRTVTGTAGNDTLVSTSGHALINALGGDDVIFAAGAGNVVDAGAGNDAIRLAGSGNLVSGGDGNDTITDWGGRNTFVMNPAGHGQDGFWGQVLTNGDVFDLRSALAATSWDKQAGTLGDYLHLSTANNGADTVLSITSRGAGSAGSVIAVLHGGGMTSLSSFLAHAITS